MSNKAIEGIQPELLWERFYEISQIPRPSKKEGKVIEYLKDVANELNLPFKEDAVGNIVISLPASKGLENSRVVVLQGHVDMVCEKNKNTKFDFDNDPIKFVREGDWLKADGTTLGSDNGIGVAAGLAILTDENFSHGPIECLFTVDEETGLTGANNLQPGFITGKTLLNLDTEEDGAFYIGCAGGVDTQGSFEIQYTELSPGYLAYNLSVTGLKGGHSGSEIHLGKGNAIKILGRTLKQIEENDFHMALIEGGSKRNAIPREAEALIFVKNSEIEKLESVVKEFESLAQIEFNTTEPGLKINLVKQEKASSKVFTKDLQNKLIDVILGLPHGVVNMSPDIPDLVETSTNLATVTINDGIIVIGTSQRSSVESAKYYIQHSVESVFNLAVAKVLSGDGYQGWKPNLDSEILKISKDVFKKLFGEEPALKAVHAGLECGILGDKYPGLDMISFGPTIEGAHSPDEKVKISTVEKFYNLLKVLLEELAKQKN
ncbi:MAG: aminoacyl-histidine dipeptidase [Ignavibacteriales bacterium]|nr:aminoacyl-histidine dipeptidase [Ignavibacteriales bacterium]